MQQLAGAAAAAMSSAAAGIHPQQPQSSRSAPHHVCHLRCHAGHQVPQAMSSASFTPVELADTAAAEDAAWNKELDGVQKRKAAEKVGIFLQVVLPCRVRCKHVMAGISCATKQP